MRIITHTLAKLLILITFSFVLTAEGNSDLATTNLDRQIFSAYDFTNESNIIFTTDSADSEALPSLYIFKYNLLRINDLDKETGYVAYNNFANLSLVLNRFAKLGYSIASSGISEESTKSSKNYYLVAYVVKNNYIDNTVNNEDNPDATLESDSATTLETTSDKTNETIEDSNQFSLARKEKFDLKTENNSLATINFDLNLVSGDRLAYAKASEKLRYAFESGKYINFVNNNNYDTSNMIYNQSLLAKGTKQFTVIVSDAVEGKAGLVEFVKTNGYEMEKFLTMLNDNEISLLDSFATYLYK